MKSAILNFALLSTILFVAFFVAMATPLSNISHKIEPPEKTQRHIYLEGKKGHGYTREEMDELYEERKKFEKRWDEKGDAERVDPIEGFNTVLNRMQFVFILIVFIFSIFYRIKSYLDLFSIFLSLILMALIVPVLSVYGFVFSVVSSSFISIIRISHNKGDRQLNIKGSE